MSNERYTTEDPTSEELAKLREKYQAGIAKIALDDDATVAMRLHTLDATLRGNWHAWHTNKTVEKLSLIANGKPILVRSTIGVLDESNPWQIVASDDEAEVPILDFILNFEKAFKISGSETYLHESYNQVSPRTVKRPHVVRLDGEELPLSAGIAGENEGFYDRLEEFVGAISIDEGAIHRQLASTNDPNLHAAASIATSRLAA